MTANWDGQYRLPALTDGLQLSAMGHATGGPAMLELGRLLRPLNR